MAQQSMKTLRPHVRQRLFRATYIVIIVLCMMLGFAPDWTPGQDISPVTPVPHPRLFFTANDIPMLRQQAATTHAHIRQPIETFARLTLTQIPNIRHLRRMPCENSPDATINQFGDALIPLAFSAIITGDSAYADAAKTALLTYASWPSWGLDGACDAQGGQKRTTAAHLLFGSSIAYDWLYEHFTPEEHAIMTQALIKQATAMYEAGAGITNSTSPGVGWWRNAFPSYQHMVNFSALGLAALALEGETRDAQPWLELASRHAKLHQALLQGIADGTWHEGTTLQTSMLGMSLPFLYNVRKLKGIDYIAHTYYKAFSSWMLYNRLPQSTRGVMGHGDTQRDSSPGRHYEILSFIAGEYRNGHAQWLIEQLAAMRPRAPKIWHAPWSVFEFLFHDPLVFSTNPGNRPLSHTFADLSGVIWRTGWGPQDLVLALKTGAHGGRFAQTTFVEEQYPWNTNLSIDYDGDGIGFDAVHDHEDTNTFSLWKGNIQLTGELTGDSDAHPMYSRTSVHNSILIDGKGQIRPPATISGTKHSDGRLEAVYLSDHFNYLLADATNRYRTFDAETAAASNIAQRIKRHVLFVKPAYLIMIDDIAAENPHEYAWVAHFGKSVQRNGNWLRGEPLVYENDDARPNRRSEHVLGVYVLNPPDFRVEIGVDAAELSDVEKSQNASLQPLPFRNFVGKPYVRVRPEALAEAVQFVHVLYPTTVRGWHTKPDIQSLGVDRDGAGIRVLLNGTQDHLVKYDEQETLTRDEYTLNGIAAGVHKDPGGAITAMFLAHGTTLTDRHGARQLITADAPVTVDVTYSAPWVRLSGEVARGTTVTVYSPDFQELTVNGQYVNSTRVGDSVKMIRPF